MIILLLGRLGQIQLFQAESFTEKNINLIKNSVAQRAQEIVIDDGRGQIIDRNGDPLTYSEKAVLVLFPFLKNIEWDAQKVANILNIPVTSLYRAVESETKPFAYGKKDPYLLTEKQLQKINELHIPGVIGIKRKEVEKDIPGAQLMGIVAENKEMFLNRYPRHRGNANQKIGISGLQHTFDEFLLGEEESKLIYHVDGIGNQLFGLNVKYTGENNQFYPLNIKSTIDKELQQKVEKILDKHQLEKGGVVLLDVEKSEILVMASRPQINKDDPYKDNGIQNLMMKQHIPGSIFKTVVAAAVIEHHLVDDKKLFNCDENIYGKPDQRKLGKLNFEASFAQSCNRTFGDLAKHLKQIDKNILDDYAEKLALIGLSGWRGNVYHYSNFKQLSEEKGRIFLHEENRKDDNYTAQTGIGQHEVRVTPLAATNMMATIARGGKKYMVNAVSEIEYKNGTTMTTFPKKRLEGEIISNYTVKKLQYMLKEVVQNNDGTGSYLKNLPYDVAGKTGTAETGKFTNNQQHYNKWFTGYFPTESPKYALTVVSLDVLEEEGSVLPLFSDIVHLLSTYDEQANNSTS